MAFFPEATIKRASAYRFQMHVEACDGVPLEIQWLDYPGEWWEREPADAKEKKQRDDCLKRMVHSHVCFLVIDGRTVSASWRNLFTRSFGTHDQRNC